MKQPVDQKLKDFIDDHFDQHLLKAIGWMPKRARKIDYEDIGKKICHFFGYDSPYEYGSTVVTPTFKSPTVENGKFPDIIDKDGNLTAGGGYHLDLVETAFTCPICTCEQDATEHRKFNNAKFPVVEIKCKGCKRPLRLYNDQAGNLTVTEITHQ